MSSFVEELEAWRKKVKSEVSKYWWWPIVGFVGTIAYGVLEHRFYSSINDYLDTTWISRIGGIATAPTARIVLVGLLLIVLPFVLIVVHAYWSTRVTERRPVFEAEIYRVVTTGKGMGAEMTRDLYRAVGRLEEFAIDADVLAELYIVNTSNQKRYIRDLTGTVEVDGTTLSLVRQDNFNAFDFNNDDYEYCLNMKSDEENKFDRSDLRDLPALLPSLPIEVGPQAPLDGWVHFVVNGVDPKKLDGNRTFKFVIADSLGRLYQIVKPSETRKRGEVTVRVISRPSR